MSDSHAHTATDPGLNTVQSSGSLGCKAKARVEGERLRRPWGRRASIESIGVLREMRVRMRVESPHVGVHAAPSRWIETGGKPALRDG